MKGSPSYDSLLVVKQLGVPKIRKTYLFPGIGTNQDFRVHNSNIINLERAVKERVFNVSVDGKFQLPPRPHRPHFVNTMKGFRSKLLRFLPETIPISHSEFVGLYSDRRKVIFEKAASSLKLEAICRKDSTIKAFIKAEKINYRKKVEPAPRLIQPRDPRYTVEVGCFLKPIEKKLFAAIAKVFGNVTVMKGLNALDSGIKMEEKWNRFQKPVAVGLDASRFDQHCSAASLEWEHSIYNAMFRSDKLKELLSWQVKNIGRGYVPDGKIKYNVKGCRMSGDVNTSAGNCLIMCGLVWSYCRDQGITEYELANNGDDCIVIMETHDLEKFNRNIDNWFLAMGFRMEVEAPVYILEEVVFCQTQPVYTPRGYTMVRDPRIALAKDALSIHQTDSITALAKYLAVLGMGGISLTSGIPIWQSFYIGLCKSGKSLVKVVKNNKMVIESGMMNLARGMDNKIREVTPETRESYRLAFDIDSDMQIAMEQYYFDHRVGWETPVESEGDFNIPAWITAF
jgi:hypothetical protein